MNDSVALRRKVEFRVHRRQQEAKQHGNHRQSPRRRRRLRRWRRWRRRCCGGVGVTPFWRQIRNHCQPENITTACPILCSFVSRFVSFSTKTLWNYTANIEDILISFFFFTNNVIKKKSLCLAKEKWMKNDAWRRSKKSLFQSFFSLSLSDFGPFSLFLVF